MTTKNAIAPTSIAGSCPLETGWRISSRGLTEIQRKITHAASIDTMYWPTLKRTRQAGLPEWTSWIAEATHWAMSAGPRPPMSSSASANAADRVSSSSLPRRGIRIGSISPSSTPADMIAKGSGSCAIQPNRACGATSAARATPATKTVAQ